MDLRHLLQHGAGNGAQQWVSIVRGDILEDLLDAGVGSHRGEYPDGLSTNLRITVVKDAQPVCAADEIRGARRNDPPGVLDIANVGIYPRPV